MSDPRYWGKHVWPFLQSSARHAVIPIALHKELYRLMPVNLPCHVCGEAECRHLHLQPILPDQNMPLYVYQLRTAISLRNNNNHNNKIPALRDLHIPLTPDYYLPGLFRFLGVVFLLFPMRIAECDLSSTSDLGTTRVGLSVAQQRRQELEQFLAVLSQMLDLMIPGRRILAFASADFESNTSLLAALWRQEAMALGTPVDACSRLSELLTSLTIEAKVDLWRHTLAQCGGGGSK